MFGIFALFCGLICTPTCAAQRKNVLFIIADDMRPDIGVFTENDEATLFKDIQTPHLDALAQRSLTLTRAYSQYALCSPSRASFMTGRRPDTTRVYDLDTYWRDAGGNFSTLAQHFKENGYPSIGSGKIFHSGESSGRDDRDYSWSEDPYKEPVSDVWENKEYSWQVAEPELDAEYPQRDTLIKEYAVDRMRELAPLALNGSQPFFLAVGFHRPHLPFVAPRAFYDLYDHAQIPLAANPYVPSDLPNIAYSSWGELRAYADVESTGATGEYNTSLPDDFARDLRHAYYASISFVDSLIGELLTALTELGLDENTVVVFFSDHGFQLGEHSEWCKHTNFDIAARSPVMFRVPGVTDNGRVTSALVELVDIFPTVVEAAGLEPVETCPLDSSAVLTCHEGHSFLKLAANESAWKSSVFYQYARNSDTKMGYAVRTDDYLYIRWVDFRGIPVWNNLKDEELYDMVNDAEQRQNLASLPEYEEVIAELNSRLQEGWRYALPE